ncbi:hypothetical protein [Streptomyces sp. LBL]|uniref:hypothetical protein n=1 Tax=Streptomyces sp. LBL TaxID=2940562 RepID=UPI002473F230|nr:hypothetical protein [Streptomyces sp. LBL]
MTSAPEAAAVLQRGMERVELRYTSALLNDFLLAMTRIQGDFTRLSGTTGFAAVPDTRSRRHSHA